MSPSNLALIACQAACGDAQAGRAFEMQVVPLVETIARRWLKQHSREPTRPSAGNRTASETSTGETAAPTVSAEPARRITRAVGARLTRQLAPPVRGMQLPNDETLVARQLLDTLAGSASRATD